MSNATLEKSKTLLNHERYQVVSVVFCVLLLVWGLCCQSTTQSVIDPTQQLNRGELDAEVTNFMNTAEVRYRDLDRQDEFKRQVLERVSLWTSTGTFNLAGLIPLIASVLGVGALTDNVRKRRELKSLSNKNTTVTPTE